MDDNSDPFPQLGSVYRKGSGGSHVKRSSKNVANVIIESAHRYSGKIAAEGRGPQISTPSAWERPKLMYKLGMQINSNAKTNQNADSKNYSSCGNEFSSQQSSYFEQGQIGSAPQVGSRKLNGGEERKIKDEISNYQVGGVSDDKNRIVDNRDDEEIFGSSDDDELFDDDFDLYTSEKSTEMRKKSKWCNAFFDDLEKLTVEELNSPGRKWHCPACIGGPGAIDWYRGLEPLMYHAMMRKTRRAKLHRVFAELLDEETRKKGLSLSPLGVAFGRWQGLNERVKDYEIVWPPMVVIMNTRYEQEENGKYIGMGNRELLDHFKTYAALKARHSYGPQGHRGISVLIFDDTAAGYLEAVRLHKHFKEQGRDRDAWDSNRFPFCSGGKRQLYGYMALKEDLHIFNLHSQGRSKLKYEMRSYQEMVEKRIKQINEDSQQLVRFKDKITQEQKHSKVLAESVSRLSEELCKTIEKNHSMRRRTKLLLEENKGQDGGYG
ncbi:protein SUPPRESSOR OF GENE SILENCING 3 isoform X2 [Hevea brasiliensis]|uniref:protein SUPPRESSOR OF GENE SILENCING 3 isoform X2 n=1 Tax=Hevea brasiliensis TaxID=3981 RepID=UPI0025FB9731|nr:protein SUPPRESSOR OF GENE SILENCING 3 isoform X2 [Hevea brasiliensis]